MGPEPASDFEKTTQTQRERGTLAELWLFLLENKKWWLLPILAVLLVFGLLVLLAGTGAAPFIYTLF
jgi:hypothetical protein